jgi:hypothetical protein
VIDNRSKPMPIPAESARLRELAKAVVDLKDTTHMKLMLALLEEIDAQTTRALRRLPLEEVTLKQGACAQLDSLMALLRGQPSDGMA